MTLGKKIKHYRIAKNITQKELSKLTGIHIVTIKKYETDALTPLSKQLIKIAEALNISTDELLFNNHEKKISLNTYGDMYYFLIKLLKSDILFFTPDESKILINPYFKNFIDVSVKHSIDDTSGVFIAINNQEFLSNILIWHNQYSELEVLKLNNCDLLHKKGNELSNKEKEIVFNIEEKELKLNNIEMKLYSNNQELSRLKY